MSRPLRVWITGPLTLFAEGFAVELTGLGYKPHAVANQLQLLAHLSRWLSTKQLSAASLTHSTLNEFLAARRSQGYVLWLSAKALLPFVAYLRGLGYAIPTPRTALNPTEKLLARYRAYLLEARGLAATTARGYVDMVRPFVASRVAGDELDWNGLSAAGLIAYVLCARRGRSIGSAKLAVTALRSLLAFLHVEGLIAKSLSAVIPSVAGYRLAGLPRSLQPTEIQRLLAACDRRTRGWATGLRNVDVACSPRLARR
jgi:integrase/recombinase XerD